MNDLAGLGRALIVIGAALVAIGLIVLVGARLSLFSWLARLPGNFVIRRGPVTLYLPLMASILVSLVLTLIFWLLGRR